MLSPRPATLPPRKAWPPTTPHLLCERLPLSPLSPRRNVHKVLSYCGDDIVRSSWNITIDEASFPQMSAKKRTCTDAGCYIDYRPSSSGLLGDLALPSPISSIGSLESSFDAELKQRQDRVRQRQSVILEQASELQDLEARLQAAEARKRELEARTLSSHS